MNNNVFIYYINPLQTALVFFIKIIFILIGLF